MISWKHVVQAALAQELHLQADILLQHVQMLHAAFKTMKPCMYGYKAEQNKGMRVS